MADHAWYDWAAKAAARMDRVTAPVRRAACRLSYQPVDGVSPEEIVGERGMPEYHAPEELADGSVQATLDPLRAYAAFQEEVRDLDAELRGEYGSGIDTAILYGSNVRGLSAFPDAAVYTAGESVGNASDMDWLLVLETGHDDTAADQRGAVGDYLEGRGPAPINAEVYGQQEFVDELRQARTQVDTLDGLRDQWTTLRWPDRSVPVPYLSRFRQPLEGYIVHPDFDGEDVRTEITAGIETLLEADGTVRDDVQPDLGLMGFNTSSYEARLQDLKQNYRLGRQETDQ